MARLFLGLGVCGGGVRLGLACPGTWQITIASVTVREFGCPNEVGVSQACWVHQRYPCANEAVASGLRKDLLPGTNVPQPNTHQELMAEAGVGDADPPHGSQSSREFRVPRNPAASSSDGGEQLSGGPGSAPSSASLRHNGGVRKDGADGLRV